MKNKEYLYIGIVLLISILLAGIIFYFGEKSKSIDDKYYAVECVDAGLLLYKSSLDSPHTEGCYKQEEYILHFYRLVEFNGNHVLNEESYNLR